MSDEALLRDAPLRVLGRLPRLLEQRPALCSIAGESSKIRVVSEPQRGERPLWDFPRRSAVPP